MEILYSAVLSELVSRAVSFLLAKREEQAAAAAQEERLRSLLLRSRTIVEEAERRLVTNRAMLQQLGALRDEAFRGYYVLDAAARCRAAFGGGRDGCKDDDDDDQKEEAEAEACRRAFTLSRFNPAKRVRVPSGDPEACRASAARLRELRQAVRGLEAMIGDMKEFVVFLTTHPLLHRQPYSAHLFVDKCMFGRHMEKERIMEFLLQPEPPGAARLGVLPIVGPAHIGKSTLVEHVCHDERVRDHFSLILFYRGKSLVDETVASFRDKCVVKHQTDNEASSGQRLLIIIELFEDLDEETWKNMLYSSERSMAQGSRMIITSRSEKIVRFGTTRALRLKCLSPEAYWHFFKMTVFGSDDPGQHPKLASLAMEMASLMQGSFLFANIGAVVLRDHFDTQSWSRAVRRIREYLQKNVSLFGEYTDDIKDKDHPRFTWSLINQKPDRYCMLYDIYERGSQEEVPEIPYSDMLAGCAQPRGEYEILFWRSRIPPYLNYVCKCEILDM
ncbi:hypothetical protein SEVIR_9G497800v4 [Setaria viridis]|uniref:NB-ARC domain-containing protein n=1 Tax=Setaria viridis TaxID=4556 RepID=A0A4U6T9I2_SETVI|nr:hypothetical protein SEVIR_9G497800v2 [Setaria viridis]